jgi:hypothetical protein
MKRLPLGITSIQVLLTNNYLYIDKTKYYKKLIDEGKYFFISRPRRFGKSLLISTLKEIFNGNKELFKDQYIYKKHTFETHPIIHIDFNEIQYNRNVQEFESELKNVLLGHSKKYDVELKEASAKAMFRELIQNLSKINSVVILIDEYDKPIIEHIDDPIKANKNKEFIASFYETIKAKDDDLRFVLLTDVTKVSKTSIFSKLNNLTDITRNSKYSKMLGITEEELYKSFEDHMRKASIELDISIDELKNRLRKWYNGYSWDEENKVYNPYSILSFFNEYKFNNYWFKSGTPTFLIKVIKENNYDLANLEAIEVDENTFEAFEIEELNIHSLLYQTGYLTIVESFEIIQGYKFYKMRIPNFEVRKSLMNSFFVGLSDTKQISSKPPYLMMIKALIREDIDDFVKYLQSSFAQIPYTIYPKKEDYYHSIFYLMMNLIGADIQGEVLTDKGRIDGVIELEDKIYVVEFKTGNVSEGMKQIKSRKYYEKYITSSKRVLALSVGGFNDKNVRYLLEEIT